MRKLYAFVVITFFTGLLANHALAANPQLLFETNRGDFVVIHQCSPASPAPAPFRGAA